MLLGRGVLAWLRQRVGCLLARCSASIHQGRPLVGIAMAAGKGTDNTTKMEGRAVLGCCLHQRSKSLLPCKFFGFLAEILRVPMKPFLAPLQLYASPFLIYPSLLLPCHFP